MDSNNAPEIPCKDKIAFDTVKQANTAALVADYQHGIPLKPYLCKYCGLWHLTSDIKK